MAATAATLATRVAIALHQQTRHAVTSGLPVASMSSSVLPAWLPFTFSLYRNLSTTTIGDKDEDASYSDDAGVDIDDLTGDASSKPSKKALLNSNPALQSVINQGMDHLKATSSIIQNKKETKKPLFHKSATAAEGTEGPTKQQLAEANRILTVATRCLEELQNRKKHAKSILSIGPYPILLLHVDVNANLREATVYWALPFEVLLEVNEATRNEMTERMQNKIVHHGGGAFLQREVHRVLSHYYPPKLKFKPASNVLLQQLLHFD